MATDMQDHSTPVRQGALVFGGDARTNRGFAVAVLLGSLVVLGASFWLTPDPQGYGTHEQLLLMPCWVKLLTGIPCPFCGMTTAFVHLSRGEIVDALACHAASPLFYVLTWVVAYTGLRGVITGQWPLPLFVTSSRFGWALLVVVVLSWAVNIARTFI